MSNINQEVRREFKPMGPAGTVTKYQNESSRWNFDSRGLTIKRLAPGFRQACRTDQELRVFAGSGLACSLSKLSGCGSVACMGK